MKVYIVKSNEKQPIVRVFDSFEKAEEYVASFGKMKADNFYDLDLLYNEVLYWNPEIPCSEMIIREEDVY